MNKAIRFIGGMITALLLSSHVLAATAEFGIRGVNSIVPAQDVTKRTKQIDISSNVTGSVALSSVDLAVAVFYADSDGNWRMVYNIKATAPSATRTGISLYVSGITFDSNGNQAVSAYESANQVTGAAVGGSNRIAMDHAFDTTDEYSSSGDVSLDSEPTTYTTAANLETTDVAAYVPEATASVPGLVGTGEQTFGGDKGFINNIGRGRAPLTELDIYASEANGGSNYINIDTEGTTTRDRAIRFRWGGDSSTEGDIKWQIKHYGSDNSLSIFPEGVAGLNMSSTGNVGIGKTPLGELHVASTGPELLIDDTNATSGQRMFRISSGSGKVYFSGRNDTNSGDGVGDIMTLDLSNGNVGIGKTPAVTLDMKAISGNTSMRMTRNAYNNNAYFYFHTDGQTNADASVFWDGGANQLHFWTPNGAASADTAPSKRVVIAQDDSKTYLQLYAPSGDESQLEFFRNGATKMGFITSDDQGINIIAETSRNVDIIAGGSGTFEWKFTTAGFYYWNAVGGGKGNGSINAASIYSNGTQLTSDYVFEKEYLGYTVNEKFKDFKRKTLEEEIAFTKEHLHLSTIIGREEHENEETRASMGRVVSDLWKTVEVEFLYIKRLHEENEMMKSWICSRDDAPEALCVGY